MWLQQLQGTGAVVRSYKLFVEAYTIKMATTSKFKTTGKRKRAGLALFHAFIILFVGMVIFGCKRFSEYLSHLNEPRTTGVWTIEAIILLPYEFLP